MLLVKYIATSNECLLLLVNKTLIVILVWYLYYNDSKCISRNMSRYGEDRNIKGSYNVSYPTFVRSASIDTTGGELNGEGLESLVTLYEIADSLSCYLLSLLMRPCNFICSHSWCEWWGPVMLSVVTLDEALSCYLYGCYLWSHLMRPCHVIYGHSWWGWWGPVMLSMVSLDEDGEGLSSGPLLMRMVSRSH